MNRPRSTAFRIARGVGITVLALLVLYLVAGNVLVGTRLLRDATSVKPEDFKLDYISAYTLFPGHLKVRGLKLRVEDRSVQFGLEIDEATMRISLHELARRRLHVTKLRATGVSTKALHKLTTVEGNEKRIAAFPHIEGVEWPPIQRPPPPGPPASGEGIWTVHIEDVEIKIRELWFFDFHYEGQGVAVGAFELTPMKSLWVGPASIVLKEGTLSTGKTVVSKNFALEGDCTITPVDIMGSTGLQMVRPITASAKISALLDDVGVAEQFTPAGVKVSGTGTLLADVRVVKGAIAEGTEIEVHVGDLKLRGDGVGFDGTLNAKASMAPDAKGLHVPIAHAAASGAVQVALSPENTVTAKVPAFVADVSLDSPDAVEGLGLQWLHARVAQVRVDDAKAITAEASKKAPFIAPAVLGNGPLIATATIDVTKGKTVVRLEQAKLGDAEVSGVAMKTGEAWNGAAAGRVAVIPVGLRMKNGTLEVLPFIRGTAWLEPELQKLGLEAEISVR